MLITVATATLYFHPFEPTLQLIAEAGFQYVELDLFWERKTWAMAQHLRGIPARQVVQQIRRAGLRVASIHDGGGVLDHPHSARGFLNPSLDEYLDCLGYAPDCLVLHTPHVEWDGDLGWWKQTAGRIVGALEPYRPVFPCITLENMPGFPGYSVPLITPETLLAFTAQHNLGVTLDTTHYAQIGIDVVAAARTLRPQVRTIHLSDYAAGSTHVFIGDGDLDLVGMLHALDRDQLRAVTLECALSSPHRSDREMDDPERLSRLCEARARLEQICG